jgi:hypothetical protein
MLIVAEIDRFQVLALSFKLLVQEAGLIGVWFFVSVFCLFVFDYGVPGLVLWGYTLEWYPVCGKD